MIEGFIDWKVTKGVEYSLVTNVNPQLDVVTDIMSKHHLEKVRVLLINQKYVTIQYDVQKMADPTLHTPLI